ncbi:DUF2358 domain containing protein [Nitzschia inconspicua]|uniref:DUF2358 domain containing protein n=1 Tax=Nitzschia inconspicua TaxID=303405 RepID=A0A9K3L7F3_9STRA|nr:DUF2358 domain containing protein [Nitzschia inconspicua]
MRGERRWCASSFLLPLVALAAIVDNTDAFHVVRRQQRFRPTRQQTASSKYIGLYIKDGDDDGDLAGTKTDMNPFTKSVWYGVEKFGQVFGNALNNNSKKSDTFNDKTDFSGPPSSLKETLNRIQIDNDRSYFLSGEVDKDIYADDCLFEDPFVSFRGRDRFVDNLQNLGSFITKFNAKVISYSDVMGNNEKNIPPTIETKIMVKLELNLPWKPVLAWPWGVTYEIDPNSYLITKHEESWDIEPWEGVKQIFRKATVKI